jgi:hypothetical protein
MISGKEPSMEDVPNMENDMPEPDIDPPEDD